MKFKKKIKVKKTPKKNEVEEIEKETDIIDEENIEDTGEAEEVEEIKESETEKKCFITTDVSLVEKIQNYFIIKNISIDNGVRVFEFVATKTEVENYLKEGN